MGAEQGPQEVAAVVYCVVPRRLAGKLHDLLRRHFADDPTVEVVVERRGKDRRTASGRRATTATADVEAGGAGPQVAADAEADRRRIRHAPGRRVADRRAASIEIGEHAIRLPRRARPHAAELTYFERIEPATRQLEDVDSARLVIQLQAGDRDAFNALYLRYFDRVYSYNNIALRDSYEAEDATQQVFAKAFEALPRFELRETPFRAWLFRIARNTLLNQMKLLDRVDVTDPATLVRRREAAVEDEHQPIGLDWITDRELLMFVERLPLAQRQVLVLKYMLGLTTSDIAAVMERKEPDVRVLLHRAIAFLRDRLAAVNRAPGSSHRGRVRMHRRMGPAVVMRARRYAIHR